MTTIKNVRQFTVPRNLRTDEKLPTAVEILEETLEHAFPDVEPGVRPYGSRVLVQIKNGAGTTKAGLWVNDGLVQTENDNTQVAKVVKLGIGAFRSRSDLSPWPELDRGDCPKVGDFVRIPLHTNTQNAWTVPVPGKDYRVTFTLVDDLQILGEQPDPFYIRAFL